MKKNETYSILKYRSHLLTKDQVCCFFRNGILMECMHTHSYCHRYGTMTMNKITKTTNEKPNGNVKDIYLSFSFLRFFFISHTHIC
jgi:hypothetical protein